MRLKGEVGKKRKTKRKRDRERSHTNTNCKRKRTFKKCREGNESSTKKNDSHRIWGLNNDLMRQEK